MARGDKSSQVHGNVEWIIENAFVDIINYDLNVSGVMGEDSGDVNVRVARDATPVQASSADGTEKARAYPAIAVEAASQQTIPNTNEYRCTMRFICETDAHSTDKSGEQVKALIGAIRDIIHGDEIITRLNSSMRGAVMNSPDSLHELSTEDDSELESGNFTRRMILQADAWVYVGRAS